MKRLLLVLSLALAIGGCPFPNSKPSVDPSLEVREVHIYFGTAQSVEVGWAYLTAQKSYLCGTVKLPYSTFKDLDDAQLALLLSREIMQGSKTPCK